MKKNLCSLSVILFLSIVNLATCFCQTRIVVGPSGKPSPTGIPTSGTVFAEMGHSSGLIYNAGGTGMSPSKSPAQKVADNSAPKQVKAGEGKGGQAKGGPQQAKTGPQSAKGGLAVNKDAGLPVSGKGVQVTQIRPSGTNALGIVSDSVGGGTMCDGTGLCGASGSAGGTTIPATFTYYPGPPCKITMRFSLSVLLNNQPSRAAYFYNNAGAVIPSGSYPFVDEFEFSDNIFMSAPLSMPPGKKILAGTLGTYTITGGMVEITVPLPM